jgi:hypothetical protein
MKKANLKLHLPSIRGNFYTKSEFIKMLQNKHLREQIFVYSEFAIIGGKKIPIECKYINGRTMYKLLNQ